MDAHLHGRLGLAYAIERADPECPVEAIMPDTEVEPAQRAFIEIKAAVRAGPRATAVALEEVLARASEC